MNVFGRVAGNVFAEFLEFAALADLPAFADPVAPARQKHRRDLPSLDPQIRIDAQFRRRRKIFPPRPQAES